MKIVLIGNGGHSKVIRDMVVAHQELELVGYLDDKFKEVSSTGPQNLWYAPIAAAQQLIQLFDSQVRFFIAIGNNQTRKSIAERISLTNDYYLTLVHQSAVVSPSANLGSGTVVMANAVIHADAQIGCHSIINTGAIVEHDNQLSHYVHISPGAVLTGAVTVDEGVQVGAGATIIPNVKIREWSIIGAGATVIRDIPANCTAVGTPAKIIKDGVKQWGLKFQTESTFHHLT